MSERHRIAVGTTLKVGKITTRLDSKGVPVWNFNVPFVENRNGEYVTYDFITILVRGGCEFDTGDIVRVTEIESLSSSQYRNHAGGFSVGRMMVCKVEGVRNGRNNNRQ